MSTQAHAHRPMHTGPRTQAQQQVGAQVGPTVQRRRSITRTRPPPPYSVRLPSHSARSSAAADAPQAVHANFLRDQKDGSKRYAFFLQAASSPQSL